MCPVPGAATALRAALETHPHPKLGNVQEVPAQEQLPLILGKPCRGWALSLLGAKNEERQRELGLVGQELGTRCCLVAGNVSRLEPLVSGGFAGAWICRCFVLELKCRADRDVFAMRCVRV